VRHPGQPTRAVRTGSKARETIGRNGRSLSVHRMAAAVSLTPLPPSRLPAPSLVVANRVAKADPAGGRSNRLHACRHPSATEPSKAANCARGLPLGPHCSTIASPASPLSDRQVDLVLLRLLISRGYSTTMSLFSLFYDYELDIVMFPSAVPSHYSTTTSFALLFYHCQSCLLIL
jgi:hypothetical protein